MLQVSRHLGIAMFQVELPSRGAMTVGSLSFNDVVDRLLNERGGEIDRGDDRGFFPIDFVIQRDLEPGVYFSSQRWIT